MCIQGPHLWFWLTISHCVSDSLALGQAVSHKQLRQLCASDNHLELSACFEVAALLYSLSTLFSSPSLLPIEMSNKSNVLLSTLLAIISLDNRLAFLCLCELLMPSGQRAFKSKAVVLSAVNQQRQDKWLTQHSHVRGVKWCRLLGSEF